MLAHYQWKPNIVQSPLKKKKKKRFSVSCLLPYDLGSLCKRNENMSVERLLLKGTQQPKCPRAEVCVNRLNIHIICNHVGGIRLCGSRRNT